ncbi:MAG: hypothetical protein IPG50_01925 [Myxococcales bacterium]|nr:hypothetical protein [Myxococcales bacterium]
MAIIAVHRESGAKYVILGGGIRMFTPSPPIKAESQRETSHASRSVPVTMMATCDGEGVITWFRCEDMRVIEIDGAPPSAVLASRPHR